MARAAAGFPGRLSQVGARSRNNFAAAKNKRDARSSRANRFRVVHFGSALPALGPYHALVGVARGPPILASGENSLRLTRREPDKIVDVVKDSRRDENQAVKAIQQTAVAWNELGSVLKAQIAFDRREHQIAELANDADDDAKANQTNCVVERCVTPNEMSSDRHQRRGQHNCA